MSDLISRSAVIDIIHRYSCNTARIEENVLDLPTAYDVSKVVAELEYLQCVNPFLTTTEYEHKAIEIARKGGVE